MHALQQLHVPLSPPFPPALHQGAAAAVVVQQQVALGVEAPQPSLLTEGFKQGVVVDHTSLSLQQQQQHSLSAKQQLDGSKGGAGTVVEHALCLQQQQQQQQQHSLSTVSPRSSTSSQHAYSQSVGEELVSVREELEQPSL